MRRRQGRMAAALGTVAVVLLGTMLSGCPDSGDAVQIYLTLVAQGLVSPVGLVQADDGETI